MKPCGRALQHVHAQRKAYTGYIGHAKRWNDCTYVCHRDTVVQMIRPAGLRMVLSPRDVAWKLWRTTMYNPTIPAFFAAVMIAGFAAPSFAGDGKVKQDNLYEGLVPAMPATQVPSLKEGRSAFDAKISGESEDEWIADTK